MQKRWIASILHGMKPAGQCVLWWELRRAPYNLILAITGLITITVLEVVGAKLLRPGEDAIEPMALFLFVPLYAIAANVAYTLGWATELMWSGGDPTRTQAFRSKIFYFGLFISVGITLVPAFLVPVLWVILQVR